LILKNKISRWLVAWNLKTSAGLFASIASIVYRDTFQLNSLGSLDATPVCQTAQPKQFTCKSVMHGDLQDM
jgi:hypothetical protein